MTYVVIHEITQKLLWKITWNKNLNILNLRSEKEFNTYLHWNDENYIKIYFKLERMYRILKIYVR